ncbi:hypothetical protein NDU88_007590 [Pleurodeles waltl]|uniref:Uncharacterized protein n=1 Tax=Pleurodeles waltl TaxID=8319 RepID=A0AAV7RTH5_PLEWA|nr:hypothetical protein NDU88_007590 [Pleurodeles waltl]
MQISSWVGTPDSTRESGARWGRAALEVRRVKTLTSRVALRGVIGSTLGRGSTSRGATWGRRRELLVDKKGEETLPFARALRESVISDKLTIISQEPGGGGGTLNFVVPASSRGSSLSRQALEKEGELSSEGDISGPQGESKENSP